MRQGIGPLSASGVIPKGESKSPAEPVLRMLTGPERSESVPDVERLFVFHQFISVRKYFGSKAPVHGMSGRSGVLAAEVMQSKSCWITDAESTVSGQVTTTDPSWQQSMTDRSIRTANDQTLGRQPGSLKKRRRSPQNALQRWRNCPHDQSPMQRILRGVAAFPATT